MKHCFTCGGQGFIDKECPECGREPRNKSLNLDKMENVQEFVKKINNTMIPSKYHGVFWSKDILEREYSSKLSKYNDTGFDDQLFIGYVAQLDKINTIYSENRLPHKSAIIIAPAGYSKITFAYSCMQRALNAGYSVAPLLDTSEVKRALILSSENVRYKINGYLSYEDYIMSDVMFVTVTKLYTYGEAYQVIQELIDRRSRKGLSTFILSRFSLNELSQTDRSHSFEAIKKVSYDAFKYPAIIQYKER
jgi:hypothetical protein